MDKDPPLKTLRDGRLKATIWENYNEKNELYYTIALAKTYEDRDGKLRDTSSFSSGELLRVAELSREAHGVVRDIQRELAVERRAAQKVQQLTERSNPSPEVTPARFRDRSGPSMDR